MATQALDAIIRELDASYNPSRQSINDRINSLQGAEQADMQGLQGTQQQAFGDIVSNAQERGVAFGGIPSGEQAKYTSTQFLPAVAKLKSNYVQARGGLSDALNSLNLDQNKTALSIREAQQGRDFQAQQAELQRQAEARARAASEASSGALNSLFTQNQQTQQAAAPKPKTDPIQQIAYNDVASRIRSQNAQQLKSDYAATLKSAQRGNQKDRLKIELYHQLRPDIFSKNMPAAVLSNGNQLRF